MWEKIQNLPLAGKIGGAVVAAGAIIAALGLPMRALWILIAALVLAALFIAAFFLLQRVLQKRRARSMTGQLSLHSTVMPRGISEPAQRAKLDNLRLNFQKGIEKFRVAGKDLYSLPWYVVVGEPGSGKTEAVRHCNVGFPPGLQDELQGAGGTINMNWWFTNYAVLLDTAGRLMFEEVAPGTTSEWREFLNLLRARRPHCPINGLTLVIPSDSLIKDTSEEIAQKASRIAQQFNTIQTALDVRFPVFVLVTKTDLINGFRDFFEGVKDPHLQHQMLGWSNPDGLDQKFRPELVDEHLDKVVQRIRRRRLGMLQDPTPRGEISEGRRLDDVDALFALPASLALLAPRLRRYLEMIFMPNEWSGKPLFLRGIYFTSAMREGSALDQELAEAIGVPVDSLPEGRTWERERAYFLRDMFVEKIFREKGLVTRATNTVAMLRRQQLIIVGSVAVLLVVLGLWAWIGHSSVRASVGRETESWQVAREGWQDGVWRPIVSPEFRNSHDYVYNSSQRSPEVVFGNERMSLANYHRHLADLVSVSIDVPWIFTPMSHLLAGTNASRLRAQRIVFEASVVKPLVEAARDKIEHARDNWDQRSASTLVSLVQIEGMIYRRQGGELGTDEVSAATFFEPLGSFVYNDPKGDPSLIHTFEWIYLKSSEGRGYWPPRWLSRGFSLKDNRPIDLGLRALLGVAGESQKAREAGFAAIKNMRDEFAKLRKFEEEMARIADQPNSSDDALKGALNAFVRQRSQVEFALKNASQTGLFPPGPLPLGEAYKLLVEETRRQSETTFKQLQTEIERFDRNAESSFPLAGDIRRKLQEVQTEFAAMAESSFPSGEVQDLQALDRLYLERAPSGESLYGIRSKLYVVAKNQMDNPGGLGASIIGQFTRCVEGMNSAIADALDQTSRYQGAFSVELGISMRRLLDLAKTQGLESLYDRYASELEARLREKVRFPLLRDQSRAMTVEDVRGIQTMLLSARGDLPALRASRPPNRSIVTLDVLEKRVQDLSAVADGLLSESGKPSVVAISTVSEADAARQLVQKLGESGRGKRASNPWPIVRVNRSSNQRLRAPETTLLMRVPISDELFQLEFLEKDTDVVDGPTVTFSQTWAPLKLMHQGEPRRLPGDGTEWEVILPVESQAGAFFAILRLTFEKPLPDIQRWPTAASVGL